MLKSEENRDYIKAQKLKVKITNLQLQKMKSLNEFNELEYKQNVLF